MQIAQLRRNIRRQRRLLNPFELRQAAQKINYQIQKHPSICHAKNIGLYLDAFGEVPTQSLIFRLIKQGKSIYLPVIGNMNQQLLWRKISVQQLRSRRLMLHGLGMKQSMQGSAQSIAILDVVCMPLVIFDQHGNRVGMGGGFYDRTLAQHPHKPIRIGLAYDFQKSEQPLIQQKWDQKLDSVCTPNKIWRFKR